MAKEFNCSYEAVRQQTKRYSKELSVHAYSNGRITYYDQWAVDFIDRHRNKNIVVEESNDIIEELQKKNEILLEKVALQADKLAAQSEELRNYDKLMLESGNKLKLAESRADEAEQRAAENEKNATKQQETMVAQQNEIAELKAQLEAERNRKLSFAERFRGRKKHRD